MKCIICGEDNRCELGIKASCWCEQLYIPPALLGEVPVDKRGKVCICQNCVEKSHYSV